MDNIVEQLKALGEPTRLRIINLLYEKELCVCDIMDILALSQTKTSRHLAYLKHAGMVVDRKQAQWTYYSLNRADEINYLDVVVSKNLAATEPYMTDINKLRQRPAPHLVCQKEGVNHE